MPRSPERGTTPPATDDRWREAATIALITVAVAAATFIYQPQIAVNGGRGWDGSFYYTMAEEVGRGGRVLAEAPFVYRLLVPALAGTLSPGDVMTGFKVVNGVAVLLVVALLAVWLRRHLRAFWVRVTVMALFMAQWTEPLRTFFWYPVLVDYWLVAAILAGLLIIDRLRAGGRSAVWVPALCAVTVVAVAVREIGMIIPLAALFTHNPVRGAVWKLGARLREARGVRAPLWAALPIGLVTVATGHLMAVGTGTYDFVRSVGYWVLTKSPAALVLGWLVSYGPVLLLPVLAWRECARWLRDHQAEAVFLLGVAAVSWIGGSDTERFVAWGAPVVYVLIGIGLQQLAALRVPAAFWVVLAAAQVVVARVPWIQPAGAVDAGTVPELVVLTPVGNDVSVYDLTAGDAAPIVRWTQLAEYAVLFAVLVAVHVIGRRRRAAAVTGPLPVVAPGAVPPPRRPGPATPPVAIPPQRSAGPARVGRSSP